MVSPERAVIQTRHTLRGIVPRQTQAPDNHFYRPIEARL